MFGIREKRCACCGCEKLVLVDAWERNIDMVLLLRIDHSFAKPQFIYSVFKNLFPAKIRFSNLGFLKLHSRNGRLM